MPPAGIEPAKPATGENDDKAPVFEGIMGTRRPPGRRHFRKHKCRKNLRKSQWDWRAVRHAAPRPQTAPSPLYHAKKQERGDSPAHEPGIEPGTVPTKTFGDTRAKQKRSTPLFTKQNMLSRKKPHVLGHYSFLDMYTVWGNNSPPGTYTVWGQKS